MTPASIVTRSFTPLLPEHRLDAYRSARVAHRDDYEFTRAHREGCALQCMTPQQRRDYLAARPSSPVPATVDAAQGLHPVAGLFSE